MKNLQEQTDRIKQLFGDDRLWGNLVDDKPNMIIEQEEIKQPAGDPYEYKKDGEEYFFRNVKKGETEWKKASGNGLNAIKSKIFNVSGGQVDKQQTDTPEKQQTDTPEKQQTDTPEKQQTQVGSDYVTQSNGLSIDFSEVDEDLSNSIFSKTLDLLKNKVHSYVKSKGVGIVKDSNYIILPKIDVESGGESNGKYQYNGNMYLVIKDTDSGKKERTPHIEKWKGEGDSYVSAYNNGINGINFRKWDNFITYVKGKYLE